MKKNLECSRNFSSLVVMTQAVNQLLLPLSLPSPLKLYMAISVVLVEDLQTITVSSDVQRNHLLVQRTNNQFSGQLQRVNRQQKLLWEYGQQQYLLQQAKARNLHIFYFTSYDSLKVRVKLVVRTRHGLASSGDSIFESAIVCAFFPTDTLICLLNAMQFVVSKHQYQFKI